MTGLVEKILLLHGSLSAATVPHAFGGALALAWCTQRARGTVDVDLNVFVAPEQARRALGGLPPEVARDERDRELLVREGQARLWWDRTPVDLFLNTTPFHEQVSQRVQVRVFAGQPVPFLSCTDLAVFKAFFDRPQDRVDLAAMAAAGALDLQRVVGVVTQTLGADDPRIARLRDLPGP